MVQHDQDACNPEASSGIDRERQGSEVPAIQSGADHSAESGIEQFCNQQARNALKVFQEIVAED